MNALKDGWFTEMDSSLFPGHCFSLEVDQILFEGKSKYQNIIIFKNKTFGNVLSLDGRIQVTEKDEFSYSEMISFLPLNSHPNPERVLIIGGGDGSVARECAKHPLVKQITQCELDDEVIRVAKLYLPSMALGFSSEKMKLVIGDGFEFLRNNENQYDVIITDSSDPEGPARCLFEKQYYNLMKNALRENGIVCCQGESFWTYSDLISNVISFAGELFPTVSYGQSQIPCYPSGSVGFILCSLEKNKHFSNPIHVFDDETEKNLKLKYYNSDLHRSAFILPTFCRNILKKASQNYSI